MELFLLYLTASVLSTITTSVAHNAEQAEAGLHVNLRRSLEKRTTGVHAKCRNIYKSNAKCNAWANDGECKKNPSWMHVKCAKSCHKCTEVDTASKCRNVRQYDAQCNAWAYDGECNQNPVFMHVNCAKSCHVCAEVDTTDGRGENIRNTDTSKCRNIHENETDCDAWAQHNHCKINPGWMLIYCAKSCNCTEVDTTDSRGENLRNPDTRCRDVASQCAEAARNNKCKTNAGYMHKYCQKSCKVCDH
ncbi:hypothetical protein BsWGS_09611 [Bradybaena similaris]